MFDSSPLLAAQLILPQLDNIGRQDIETAFLSLLFFIFFYASIDSVRCVLQLLVLFDDGGLQVIVVFSEVVVHALTHQWQPKIGYQPRKNCSIRRTGAVRCHGGGFKHNQGPPSAIQRTGQFSGSVSQLYITH